MEKKEPATKANSEQPIKPTDVTKNDRFAGIKAFLNKRPPKKRLLVVGGVGLGVLLLGAIGAFTLISDSTELNPEPSIESTFVAPPPMEASPLTGVLVTPEQAARPITAVTIENSNEARPQSGMDQAGIVFEAIAEGGITRFLAVYQEARPSNIGPIRSARPYFVEWARGFDASYLHSGGSPEALGLIPAIGVKDLDHGTYGDRIANRVSTRFSPHNVYSNFDLIDSLNTELGFTSSEYDGFARKDDTPPTIEAPATANRIDFNISGANYNTFYTYDAASNSYLRHMAGVPHNDRESGKQLNPKVVVALVMTYGIHSNGVHSVYGSIGSGSGFVFQDGVSHAVTWRKRTQTAPLELLDASGNPFELNAGQTWITAIQSGRVASTP